MVFCVPEGKFLANALLNCLGNKVQGGFEGLPCG